MDRFSSLPDEVLCHILSFLPTKQSALTSSLSKRWLNLWELVPHLDIDDSVFLHPEEDKGERDETRQGFVDFVDRVLARQGDSPVEKFSLKCITGIHPDVVNRWIRNVLKRGVSDLNIFTDFTLEDIEELGCYYLPEELFFSKTLVDLKLRSEHCVDWYSPEMGSSLPMLKTLDIESELIFCEELEKFVPSFPVLETLGMANMEWRDSDHVTVSSASLKTLCLHATGCEGFENPKSISFDIPNLHYLSYFDLVAEDYPLVNMEKLSVARLKLMLTEDQFERIRAPNNVLLEEGAGDDVFLRFGNLVKLMNGIQTVHNLHLLFDTVEVLSLCCESMPVFNNLKLLAVTSDPDRGWQAMPVLLRNSPHLEIIIFEGLFHHETDKCGDACPCISREDKGRSLSSCPVKMIEIIGFRGTMKEMTMIKHFVDYFPCLEEMNVFTEGNDPTQLRNPVVSNLVIEMFELYSKLSSCKVQLMVNESLDKLRAAQGHM